MLRPIKRKLAGIRKRLRKNYWRKKIMRQAGSCKSPPNVNARSQVTGKTHLGHNVNFNGMEIVGGGSVTIGDNFHSGIEVRMITQIHDYDHGDAIPYDATYIYKDIVIEDNVWIGDRVIILGGVTIGEGAIVQAGSVVVKDIPACAIAGGHPAQVFKSRDVEHYERLKKAGKFH